MENNSHKYRQGVISATYLQRQVGTVIRRVAVNGEHVTVERDGFPVMVILPIADYRALAKRPTLKRSAK